MPKPRSDSLYAKLTPSQRETLFERLIAEGIAYDEAARWMLEVWGVQTSVGALCALLQRHGFAWRLGRAKAMAADKSLSLPANFEKSKRDALARREFEAALGELTIQQVIAMRKLEQGEQMLRLKEEVEKQKVELDRLRLEQGNKRLALDRERFQRECCELFLRWHADTRAREIVDSAATNAEKIEALGRRMFADWDDESSAADGKEAPRE